MNFYDKEVMRLAADDELMSYVVDGFEPLIITESMVKRYRAEDEKLTFCTYEIRQSDTEHEMRAGYDWWFSIYSDMDGIEFDIYYPQIEGKACGYVEVWCGGDRPFLMIRHRHSDPGLMAYLVAVIFEELIRAEKELESHPLLLEHYAKHSDRDSPEAEADYDAVCDKVLSQQDTKPVRVLNPKKAEKPLKTSGLEKV